MSRKPPKKSDMGKSWMKPRRGYSLGYSLGIISSEHTRNTPYEAGNAF
jgi:hypothetical protein